MWRVKTAQEFKRELGDAWFNSIGWDIKANWMLGAYISEEVEEKMNNQKTKRPGYRASVDVSYTPGPNNEIMHITSSRGEYSLYSTDLVEEPDIEF